VYLHPRARIGTFIVICLVNGEAINFLISSFLTLKRKYDF
jgi:hypothetical protein